MTLVEVMAGTVLLATLLVSMLITDGRLTRQSHRTALRQEACQIADELLELWWSDRDAIQKMPREGAGEAPGRPGWRWRTRLQPSKASGIPLGQVVCLEIFLNSQNSQNDTSETAESADAEPLATVDVLLYEPISGSRTDE